MEKKDTILKVQDLRAQFVVGKRRVHAVNGVSFELRRGSTLGIVGESGCGKSATAHSILQLLPRNGIITGGEVDYFPPGGDRQRLTDYDKKSRAIRRIRGKEISMIFQDPLSSLDPVYKVGDQIAENIRAHEKISKKEARERAIAMLGKLGIPKPELRVDDYPHQFSGGMKQRVMIAIAMVCNPGVLIADEPTTALDVTIQAQILALMAELQRERGTAIMLITHNMGIVAEICDEVAVMYMGTVVEFGSAEQVFTNPLHPYTKALMQAVPVLGMGKDKELKAIRGSTPDGFAELEGCPFADRCEQAFGACTRLRPKDLYPETGHRVRCHLYDKEVAR